MTQPRYHPNYRSGPALSSLPTSPAKESQFHSLYQNLTGSPTQYLSLVILPGVGLSMPVLPRNPALLTPENPDTKRYSHLLLKQPPLPSPPPIHNRPASANPASSNSPGWPVVNDRDTLPS